MTVSPSRKSRQWDVPYKVPPHRRFSLSFRDCPEGSLWLEPAYGTKPTVNQIQFFLLSQIILGNSLGVHKCGLIDKRKHDRDCHAEKVSQIFLQLTFTFIHFCPLPYVKLSFDNQGMSVHLNSWLQMTRNRLCVASQWRVKRLSYF